MKEECKVSCVIIVTWLIVVKEGTNALSFQIFDYGAEHVLNVVMNLVPNSISCLDLCLLFDPNVMSTSF